MLEAINFCFCKWDIYLFIGADDWGVGAENKALWCGSSP